MYSRGTYVVSGKMVNVALGQHGVVLKLTFTQRWSIAGDDDKLGLARSKGFECRFVAQSDCRRPFRNSAASLGGPWTYLCQTS